MASVRREVRRRGIDHLRRGQRGECRLGLFAEHICREFARLLWRALLTRRGEDAPECGGNDANLHRRRGSRERQPEPPDEVPTAVELFELECQFRFTAVAEGVLQFVDCFVRAADLRVDAPRGFRIAVERVSYRPAGLIVIGSRIAKRDRLRIRDEAELAQISSSISATLA